jgi:hypothetical protein
MCNLGFQQEALPFRFQERARKHPFKEGGDHFKTLRLGVVRSIHSTD